MPTPATTPPSPERIFDTLTAYQTSSALAAAVELDLFTHLAAGADTLGALARATASTERGLRALCHLLTVRGFLAKSGERFRLAPDCAAFLDRRSPMFLGSMTGFLHGAGLRRHFEDAAASVRRGGASEGGTTNPSDPVWIDFARAMGPAARMMAGGVADVVLRGGTPRRVLDVAAGHGFYGIELARRSTATEVVSQDWENVLTVARENAAAAGLGARWRGLAGSAFEVDFGAGFELVLLVNFLHHFEREACVRLLSKARAALADGGRVAVVEFRLDEERLSPPGSAASDWTMLATTPRGQAYTAGEYAGMFRAAELGTPEVHELPGGSHAVLLAPAPRAAR